MDNIQLARNFWLSEAPCWWMASEADVAKLQETVARVLQPIRNRFGETVITSWKWWRHGCEPRTGSHAQGGTVDFITTQTPLKEVWDWGNTQLMPAGYIGRWIYEPETANQGEHIHMAPRADMVAAFGDPRIQSLQELPDGSTYVFRDYEAGTFVNPYRMEPLVVTAGRGWLWPLAAVGLAVTIATRNA